MSIAIKFEEGQNPQTVLIVFESPGDAIWVGVRDVKYYSDRTKPTEDEVRSLTNQFPPKYLKVVGDDVLEKTQAEKDAIDATEAAAKLAFEKQIAKDSIRSRDLDAIIEWLTDETNLFRALPVISLPPKNKATVLSEIDSKINSKG